MRILVVEDDPDQLAVRAMLLRQSGFVVLEANSYKSAQDAMATRVIDCAVLDLRLPSEQQGLQLLRDLKHQSPAIKVLVLTGSAVSWPDLQLADGVFEKGNSIAALLGKLREIDSQTG